MSIETTKLAPIATALVDPNNPMTMLTLTDKTLADAGVESGITIKGLHGQSDRIMCKTGAYVDLYEKVAKDAKDANTDMLDAIQADIAAEMRGWFKNFGSRDPKDKKNPKAQRRPLFNICQANYIQLGEMLKEADKDSDKFFEQLMLCTGRMLNGQPFGRVTAAEIKKTRQAGNADAAAKRKKTLQANQVKAEQQRVAEQQRQAEMDKLKKDNAELQAKLDAANKNTETAPATNETTKTGTKGKKKDIVIDLASTLAAIDASSATEQEKNAIIDNLMAALKAANIKTISDPTANK